MNSLIEKWMRICIIKHAVVLTLLFIAITHLFPFLLTACWVLILKFTDELCFIKSSTEQPILIQIHLLVYYGEILPIHQR